MNQKLSVIQALRGICIALVVVSHFPNSLGIFARGYAGVDFFFVISGFVMAITTADQTGGPRDTARFAIKRFTRIWPTFALASILIAIGLRLWGGIGAHELIGRLAQDLLFVPDFTSRNVNAPGWSLAFEIYFYALFAIAMLFPRHRLWLAVGLLCVGLIGVAVVKTGGTIDLVNGGAGYGPAGLQAYFAMMTGAICWGFIFGIGAGAAINARWSASWPVLVITAASSATLLIWMLIWGNPPGGHGPVWELPFAVLLFSLVALDRLAPLPVPGWLVLIGNVSYSIYATHWAVVETYSIIYRPEDYSTAWSTALRFGVYVAIIAAIAMPFYWMIETRLSNALRDRLLAAIKPRNEMDVAVAGRQI